MEPDDKRRIAIHEAGHCVLFVLARRRIKQSTVVPHDGLWGSTEQDPPPPEIREDFEVCSDPETEAWIHREIRAGCGGVVAEKLDSGTADFDWSMARDDLDQITGLMDIPICDTDDPWTENVESQLKLAEGTLRDNWEAVEAVAAALQEKGTLTGGEIEGIIKEVTDN